MNSWKLVNFCEIDKYAIDSYCSIHKVDKSKNLGDITKVKKIDAPFNMIVGGSPCQDFSLAGDKKGSVWTCKDCGHKYNPLTVHYSERNACPFCGGEKIEKTRSSLLVEFLRVVEMVKPNFGIYENVKNIVGKQFKDTTFKLFINELDEYGYNVYWKVLNAKDYGIPQNRERVYLIFIKKDLDNKNFTFPAPLERMPSIEKFLEDKVEEKYYVNESLSSIKEKILLNKERKIPCEKRSDEGIRLFKDNAIGTLRTISCCGDKRIIEIDNSENLRFRKITPKECFRLMGFSDEAYAAAASKVSNTQLYKQAGNSIVVDVLYYILVELYKAMPHLFDDLRLGSFFSGIGAFEMALNRLYEKEEI